MTTQQELDNVKCLFKISLEKKVQMGEIDVNPFRDVDCKKCNNYHSGILCYHYVNQSHVEYLRRLSL